MKTRFFSVWLLIVIVAVCASCLDADQQPDNTVKVSVTVNPATAYQTMVGFGGAIAWYCERLANSNEKDKINTLLFDEMGTDIIRFKTWYYPDGYPANKSTASMSDDNSKTAYEATNAIYASAMVSDPNIDIMLSSWGPPAGLKSNNSSRQGTLKKDGTGAFMYDAFADYWTDVLDNLPFNPDYISIQNEPSYINAGWTTCEWAATETTALPGYDIAFDKVSQKLAVRVDPPIMIGPESANIGVGANGNTFSTFADAIKNKPPLGLYGYHPYNFNASTPVDQTIPLLQMVSTYNNKPNLMTEYSDNMNWFTTAQFIHNTLVHANSSGYIYWKMIWATPTTGGTNHAMISIDAGGAYTVTPYYYVMKHYAVAISKGYRRIEVSSGNNSVRVSGFINPVFNSITLVAINLLSAPAQLEFTLTGSTVKTVDAAASVQGDYFIPGANLVAGQPIVVPPSSITTIVFSI